ncbi:Clp protease N-terminal domain-containing protein [Streptomyces sp. NPDC058374]|uniref:Clp protease N-terminal domain-containing protein n=1 Tax=unclassified Streptomyces TaxID=2593676 RepID=UPI00365C4FF1
MYRPSHASDPGSAPADGDPRPELANALAGARRRAQRDGDGQADTAHLLHALLEHDPASREAVDACEQGGEQLVKLLGLLVQRNIGYGLKWHGSVEDSGAVPMARADGWSPAAAGALDLARRRAGHRGGGPAGPDLLAGLVADPECRAVQVMERAGVDRGLLRRRLGADADERPGSPTGQPGPLGLPEQAGPIDVSALRRELGPRRGAPGGEGSRPGGSEGPAASP